MHQICNSIILHIKISSSDLPLPLDYFIVPKTPTVEELEQIFHREVLAHS